jgi:hypothetical protein
VVNDTSQPIFLPPSVSYDLCYRIWVHFGTGNRDKPTQGPAGRLYAIRDDGTTPAAGCTPDDLHLLTWSGNTLPETTIPTEKKGWYFIFPDEKEILFDPEPQVIPINSVPHIFFNSYQPQSGLQAGDPCGAGGNMTLYVMDLFSCSNTVEGSREAGRIAGSGLLGKDFMIYVGTGETGSIEIEKIERYELPQQGGIIYWKERKR